MARYEGSPADERNDRKMAKRRGVTLKTWENSAADRRMDAVGQRKLDAAQFAHMRPAHG